MEVINLRAMAYLAVATTVALTVIGQILQKQLADKRRHFSGMTAGATTISPMAFYCRQQLFWLALLCLGAAMLFWLYALTHIEVSKAYALLSVNYLLVPLASRLFFDEHLSHRQWLGAGILCVGLVMIGRS